ncbi:MAG: hypothetical protein U0802_17945 [Candidatus Binatia bacterium]
MVACAAPTAGDRSLVTRVQGRQHELQQQGRDSSAAPATGSAWPLAQHEAAYQTPARQGEARRFSARQHRDRRADATSPGSWTRQ